MINRIEGKNQTIDNMLDFTHIYIPQRFQLHLCEIY